MKIPYIAIGGFVCAAMLALPVSVQAQDEDYGKQVFETYCSACHGLGGKGDGLFAEQMKTKPADLTALQKNNGGVFPFQTVYETIDGRKMLAGHGSREMPIWGDFFYEEAPGFVGPYGNREEYGSIVRGRIFAVIGYIASLQVK